MTWLKQKGFTLVELLVVLMIVGILSIFVLKAFRAMDTQTVAPTEQVESPLKNLP